MIIKQQLLNSVSKFTHLFSLTPSSELCEWTSVGNSECGYRGWFEIQPRCFNLCVCFRSTGTCPTSTCCSASSCGTSVTRWSNWARAAPSCVWIKPPPAYTSTAATASGQWATRAGFVTGTTSNPWLLSVSSQKSTKLWVSVLQSFI